MKGPPIGSLGQKVVFVQLLHFSQQNGGLREIPGILPQLQDRVDGFVKTVRHVSLATKNSFHPSNQQARGALGIFQIGPSFLQKSEQYLTS